MFGATALASLMAAGAFVFHDGRDASVPSPPERTKDGAAASARQEPLQSGREPTAEDCANAMALARTASMKLPEGHLSRYFAERGLLQAAAEAGNGEFDDCIYWSEQALEEAREQRHMLRPGETLHVLRPDETPPPSPAADKKRASKPSSPNSNAERK